MVANGIPGYLIYFGKASQSEQSIDSPYHLGLVQSYEKKSNCNKETELWRQSLIRFKTQSTKAFARVRRSSNQRQKRIRNIPLIVETLLQYSNTSTLLNLTDQLFLHF